MPRAAGAEPHRAVERERRQEEGGDRSAARLLQDRRMVRDSSDTTLRTLRQL